MNKKVYQQINETLYEEVLPNGLKVYLLPKADFHKTYGLFSTNYGSVDNHFGFSPEALHQVPDGIAHFLEHKLFEKEDGDVFQTFGQQGASANAFTSFTKTSYLFSATDQIKLNLETLIDFVQAPYFTEETVEKEKGIIGQEIQMYDDDPNCIRSTPCISISLVRWKALRRSPQKTCIFATIPSITQAT